MFTSHSAHVSATESSHAVHSREASAHPYTHTHTVSHTHTHAGTRRRTHTVSHTHRDTHTHTHTHTLMSVLTWSLMDLLQMNVTLTTHAVHVAASRPVHPWETTKPALTPRSQQAFETLKILSDRTVSSCWTLGMADMGLKILHYIESFSKCFHPKRLTNEDNRSKQNQQKSNNIQVLWQISVR